MKKDLIKIFEFTKNDELLQYIEDEFTKNNIVYNIELKENWEGIRIAKYIPTIIVYVQKDKIDVAKYILEKFSEIDLDENEQIVIEEYKEDPDDDTELQSKKRSRNQKIILIILGLPTLIAIAVAIIGAVVAVFQNIF